MLQDKRVTGTASWVRKIFHMKSAQWWNLGLGTLTSNGTDFAEYQLLSYMGRVNYSFKGKYLLQASMRWDGSSRLAEGNKWASILGISAGWRIRTKDLCQVSASPNSN